jgi:hypothetical protein
MVIIMQEGRIFAIAFIVMGLKQDMLIIIIIIIIISGDGGGGGGGGDGGGGGGGGGGSSSLYLSAVAQVTLNISSKLVLITYSKFVTKSVTESLTSELA